MYKKPITKFLLLLASIIIIYSQNLFAESSLVGGITINNGDTKTTKQNVNLTITAGTPSDLTKTETSRTDFSSGTSINITSTPSGTLQLNKFFDGGFESGNFDTWDSSSFQIVSSPVASGKYAAMAKGTSKWLAKKFPSVQKSLYIKIKVLFTETTQHHYPIALSTDKSTFYALTAMPDGYFGGATYNHFPINTPYAANKWYTVECYYFGDSSTYKIIIDGVDVTKGGIPAIDWDDNFAKGIYGYFCNSTNGDGGSGGIVIDDIYITNNLPPLLDDGFESNDFSKWYNVSDSCKIVASPVKSGYKAAKVDGRMNPNNFGNKQKGYFRESIRFSSTSSSSTMYIDSGGSRETYIVASGGRWYDTYNTYYPVEVPWSPNTWYTVEIYWNVDANNYIKYDMLIDGIKITEPGGRYLRGTDGCYKTYIAAFIYASCSGIYLDDILILSDFPSSNNSTYSFSGTHTSAPIDLSSIGTAINSTMDWNATTPSGTSINIDTSLDGGSTWQSVTKGESIPGILSGTSMSGKRLLIRKTLSTTNMEATPVLQDITFTINGVNDPTDTIQMMISNNSSFAGASWQPYTISKSWQLAPGDGTKTVYIKFKDSLGESNVYSDDIILGVEVTLNQVYDEVKIRPSYRIIAGKDFRQVLYGQLEGRDSTNSVTATLVAVPGTDYKYTVLTGNFSGPGDKAVVINGTLILFDVIEQPLVNDFASVSFE